MRCDALVARSVRHGGGGNLHVFGQRQHDRTGAAGDGEMEGVADHFRHALGAVDLSHPLRHLAEHAAVIDFLKGFALGDFVVDLTDKQNQRR